MEQITEWLEKQSDSCDMCAAPMNAQIAVNFLAEYLDDGYYSMPENQEQINTRIVLSILQKHSKRFRKEYKQYLQEHKYKWR